MKHLVLFVGALAVMLGSVAAAHGQSLGDVARKEEARRKKMAKPGKVYTNDSLRGGEGQSTPADPAAAPDPAAAAPPAAEPQVDEREERKKSEAQWRERMSTARENLERSRTFQEALQTRVNALTADFTSRDDPAQRNVVAANRQKALAELERVTKEIADLEKQIRDIEEEARRAGVPPGWLR